MKSLMDKLLTMQDAALSNLFGGGGTKAVAEAVAAGASLKDALAVEIETAFAAMSKFGTDSLSALNEGLGIEGDAEGKSDPTVQARMELVAQRSTKQAQAWVANNLGQLFEAKQPLVDRLVREVTKGYLKADVLDQVVQGTRSQARTLSNTALGGVQRMNQHEVAAEISDGTDVLFLYAGPTDQKARPYCAALVDKVVTLEQLRGTPNGHNLPPHVYLGGYNCRHTLLPVSNRMVQQMGLTMATSQDYVRAKSEARR